jgi:hypothetical protein
LTDRRSFLFGAAGAFLLNANAGATAQVRVGTPAEALRTLVRVQARLDGRDTPWWYFGRIYGVVPNEPPKLLFRFEGLEIPRFTRIGEDEYAVTGVTTSFFCDSQTREVLKTFANPYTSEANPVAVNRIGGQDNRAFAFYGLAGVRFARDPAVPAPPGGLRLTWDFHGETAYMSHDREFPPGLPQPICESSVTRARIADLRDTGRPFVPAAFSSTHVSPWPQWMNMGGRPGHVVWHADGIKFESASELPAEFLRLMRSQFPDRLSAPDYHAEH